jgi:hypothetical protein
MRAEDLQGKRVRYRSAEGWVVTVDSTYGYAVIRLRPRSGGMARTVWVLERDWELLEVLEGEGPTDHVDDSTHRQ